MSEEKKVNDYSSLSEKEIKLIIDACTRKVLNKNNETDYQEGIKVLKKYFNPQNPILDINQPIPGQKDWTPLFFSTYFGKNEETKVLLDFGANPNIKVKNDINVLHIAATEGKSSLCLYFIKKGIQIDSQSTTGQTALMRACEAGHLDVVKTILPFYPNIMLEDNKKKTCLDYSIDGSYYNIVSYIQHFHLQHSLPLNKNIVPKKAIKI